MALSLIFPSPLICSEASTSGILPDDRTNPSPKIASSKITKADLDSETPDLAPCSCFPFRDKMRAKCEAVLCCFIRSFSWVSQVLTTWSRCLNTMGQLHRLIAEYVCLIARLYFGGACDKFNP